MNGFMDGRGGLRVGRQSQVAPTWVKADSLRAVFDHSFHFFVSVEFSFLPSSHFHAGSMKRGVGQKRSNRRSTERLGGLTHRYGLY